MSVPAPTSARVAPPVPRILRFPTLHADYGLGKSSVYELMRTEGFPKPVSLGPRRVGWIASEVEAWLASRPRAGAPELA